MIRLQVLLLLFTAVVQTLAFSTSLVSGKQVCISGAGPCGLFLAALLLQNEPTIREVRILEKTNWIKDKLENDFEIEVGGRVRNALSEVRGLEQRVEQAVGKRRMATRQDVCEQMTTYLQQMYPLKCQFSFGDGVESVDVKQQTVMTTRGNVFKYNVLIGADGVNSAVRDSIRNIRMTHLKAELIDEPEKQKKTLLQKIRRKEEKQDLTVEKIQCDQQSGLPNFESRNGVSHYLQIDQYNDGVIAILGDAAHAMYNDVLGQGCACGFENAVVLAKSLCYMTEEDKDDEKIANALSAYSNHAVRESHALVKLNLIFHLLMNDTSEKVLAISSALWKAAQDNTLFNRMDDYKISYSQILQDGENTPKPSLKSWIRRRIPARFKK